MTYVRAPRCTRIVDGSTRVRPILRSTSFVSFIAGWAILLTTSSDCRLRLLGDPVPARLLASAGHHTEALLLALAYHSRSWCWAKFALASGRSRRVGLLVVGDLVLQLLNRRDRVESCLQPEQLIDPTTWASRRSGRISCSP